VFDGFFFILVIPLNRLVRSGWTSVYISPQPLTWSQHETACLFRCTGLQRSVMSRMSCIGTLFIHVTVSRFSRHSLSLYSIADLLIRGRIILLTLVHGAWYMRMHGMEWRYTVAQWLRHCATNRKVAGSIPDGWYNPSGRTMALGSTQPLTEISIARAEPDESCAETRFRLSEKRISPFESAGVSAQSAGLRLCVNIVSWGDYYL
jgi:hypothetical protein